MADGTQGRDLADKFDVSERADKVLSRNTSRLYEAIAILEMASDVLTVGLDDERDQSRVMSAIDGALRIMRPVPKEIGCRVSLQHAVERMEAEQEIDHG